MTFPIRDYLTALLPAKSHIAIVSKGDPELVAMKRIKAVHFPQLENGEWAGYHPGDSAECITHLEELVAAGVRWLVIPSPYAWYLDHYAEFAAHLAARHRLISRQSHLCAVYALNPVSI